MESGTTAAETTVGIVQTNPAIGEVARNREETVKRVTALVERADPDLVVLPELASTGYVFETREEAFSLAEPPEGETVTVWKAVAAETDTWLVGGFAERDGNRLYNSAAVVSPEGLETVYRKAHLWDAEKLFFEPGDGEPGLVHAPFGRLGVQVCNDLWFPEETRLQALAGADIVALPTNWPHEGERPSKWTAGVHLAVARANTNRVFFACADRHGRERGVDFEGQSVLVGPDGVPVAGPAPADEDADLVATVDLADAREKHLAPYAHAVADRRTDRYTLRYTGRGSQQ